MTCEFWTNWLFLLFNYRIIFIPCLKYGTFCIPGRPQLGQGTNRPNMGRRKKYTGLLATILTTIPCVQLQFIGWRFPTHEISRQVMTSKPEENTYQNRTDLQSQPRGYRFSSWSTTNKSIIFIWDLISLATSTRVKIIVCGGISWRRLCSSPILRKRTNAVLPYNTWHLWCCIDST